MSETDLEWGIDFDRPKPGIVGVSALDIVHAIDQCFAYPADGFTIKWLGGRVRIPYTYGLSDLFEDLLPFLTAMLEVNGSYVITISPSEPDGVDADWAVVWEGGEVTIRADWRATSSESSAASSLSRCLVVSKAAFMDAWFEMLTHIALCLRTVEMEDIQEFQLLDGVLQAWAKQSPSKFGYDSSSTELTR